ncbi:putative acetyl-CoA acyltransferase [Starkeya nomas]|uniref:Putative acetyl-CoA acyltransferase n=1 Tax=Starkeya nomas TaxID=2666134 RepID=A0A5S9NCN3_9HYPH|nr:beta-ketoacyl synthase N-terminal-like domain-containing protein [Starkeya nomas]CAA0087388.1 putative acetyl-CoA acyltransferase [Starkeya nomas]
MSRAFLLAARRTAVAPRGGAFREVEAHDLAAPVLHACLADAGLAPEAVDHVILGNALSGGGNVARLAALAAGLPDSVPALTLDTQCCSGLDAIMLAARLVESGAARAVLAGGVESWSRAPLRARRPKAPGEEPVFYERPPFAPWPERDPDLVTAMAALARAQGIAREAQGAFAVASHAAALAARATLEPEIVPVAGLGRDAFTRALEARLCARAPVLAGEGEFAVDATGVAVEADAAAAVLVVAPEGLPEARRPGIAFLDAASAGAAPEEPAMALVPAARRLMEHHKRAPACVELMESFAAQALANIAALGLDPARVNRGGGALARGHPIGASGAILAVRLFHELGRETPGALGLAAIAAAGGLGSALMLQRV